MNLAMTNDRIDDMQNKQIDGPVDSKNRDSATSEHRFDFSRTEGSHSSGMVYSSAQEAFSKSLFNYFLSWWLSFVARCGFRFPSGRIDKKTRSPS